MFDRASVSTGTEAKSEATFEAIVGVEAEAVLTRLLRQWGEMDEDGDLNSSRALRLQLSAALPFPP